MRVPALLMQLMVEKQNCSYCSLFEIHEIEMGERELVSQHEASSSDWGAFV